jgi:hypothetical protein
MLQGGQRRFLFVSVPAQREADVRVFVIRGNMHFGDGRGADAGVGQFVADQLIEFLADDFGNTFATIGVHCFSIAL